MFCNFLSISDISLNTFWPDTIKDTNGPPSDSESDNSLTSSGNMSATCNAAMVCCDSDCLGLSDLNLKIHKKAADMQGSR